MAALLFIAAATASCTRHASKTDDSISAALRGAVDSKQPGLVADDGDRGRDVWKEEQRFYRQSGYQLAWSDGRRVRADFDALLRALRAADRDGLDPAQYHLADLEAAKKAFTRERAIDFDLRASYAYLQYASDLTHGTVDPEDVDPQWHAAPRDVDLHNLLESAVGSGGVEQSLQELAPSSPQYQGLKHQLALARSNGDAAATGQIAMNMERWRWLPDDLGSRYLIVNIPAYRLDAIENGASVLGMKVVTGKKDSPTPVLADRMTSVVFSPYWNIPTDIVDKEITPKIEKDPEYLEKQHIEVDDNGRYRQLPGPGNSLGRVKFLFPNHFNVYLHDTPAQALFNRVERDFSHGCVRVDDPDALARYVLRDQPEWTAEKISAAMQSGTEQAVKLKSPLAIYLVYFTAWEEGGALKTVPDIYGLDRRHDAAKGQ
ncbi:MAG: L,D-transpeptidase family protein [Acidobacteria bacterium]|nr:L,D-transpeptidase family protein [Acidobacteriota bacterium]